METFSADFFAQNAEQVARHLLGATLVRRSAAALVRCRIVETEAYSGTEDQASHGRNHPTPRSLPLYGTPGLSYVYRSRGIHWMFNVVCEPEGIPAAVLIRAVEPLQPGLGPTDGPGKLCKALGIDFADHQKDVTNATSSVFLEPGPLVPDHRVRRGPRVGMGKTPEPWYSYPRRWWVAGNAHVSRGSGREASVSLAHEFACPPETLWRLWTQAELMLLWFGSDPAGTGVMARSDARPGGSFWVTFRNSNGTEHTCLGEYLAVVPGETLEFTWYWLGRESHVETVEVTMAASPAGTAMRFVHRGIDPATSHDYRSGWTSTFEKLAAAVDRHPFPAS
jgi:DNA-3-methyladenine glycosylase